MRGGPKFSRYDDEIQSTSVKKSDWLENFANNISKDQNILAATRANNIYDQISNLFGRNSKHATVESIVNEYQELTGLKQYLKNIAAQSASTKNASDENINILPNINEKLKQKILDFINNRIEAYKGFVPVLALQEEILNTFKVEGIQPTDIYEQNLVKYLNSQIKNEQNKHPSQDSVQLGKQSPEPAIQDDPANTDFFHNLNSKIR